MLIFLFIYGFLLALIAARGFGTLVVPIFALSAFAGIRGNVGYDTCSYKEFFSEVLTGDFQFIEPGFFAVTWLLRQLTDDPQIFLIFISCIQGILLYAIAKKTPNKFLWVGVFTFVFYYPFFYTTLRNGVAILLLGLAYVKFINRQPLAPLYAVASTLVHYSTLPALIVFPRIGMPVFFASLGVFLLPVDQLLQFINLPFLNFAFWKFSNFKIGLYRVEVEPAWHVVAAIVLAQLSIMLTIKTWRNLSIFTILVTGFAIADFYYGRIGRVHIFGLFVLSLVQCRNWLEYNVLVKALVLAVYVYYSCSFTVYPIIAGSKVQELYASEKINSEPGNYHTWFFNDKTLCQY